MNKTNDFAEVFLQKLSGEDVVDLLSEGFCLRCRDLLQTRLKNLSVDRKSGNISLLNVNTSESSMDFCSVDSSIFCSAEKSSSLSSTNGSYQQKGSSWSASDRTPKSAVSVSRGSATGFSPASVSSSLSSEPQSLDYELRKVSSGMDDGQKEHSLSMEQREWIRFSQVGRKKDYVHMERVDGRSLNVLKGLELHTRVFNAEEQNKIVDYVYSLQRMGRNRQLRARTYSEPKKWMRGKGRVTIQFGCCYNYAPDKNGNPPGIIRDEEVDPIPSLFKEIIKRLVKWHVLPPTCVPNSCIVNIYDEGDCIPPHIDHHDFVRPFCTLSFLTEANIVFGSNLKIVAPGEFSGPVSIPLPVGSVLILSGNGADIAKHCVPAVPAKRISITFRKMDDSKLPYRFLPDPMLQGLRPLVQPSSTLSSVQQVRDQKYVNHRQQSFGGNEEKSGSTLQLGREDEFPPLGDFNPMNKPRTNKNWRQ